MPWQPISGEMGYRFEPVERQMDQDLLKQVMAYFLYPSEKWQTKPQASPDSMKNHYDFSIYKSRYPDRNGGIIRGREDKLILRYKAPQRQGGRTR